MSLRAIACLVAALALALLLALGALQIHRYGAARYTAGEQAGRNAVLASVALQAQQLQQQRERIDAFAALAGGALAQQLSRDLPAIQEQTHVATQAIRTIYRERPGAAVCTRPERVQQQLDQAIAAANAATRAANHPL